MSSAMHDAFSEPNVLKERAAAQYIGVSLSTLRRRRAARCRPNFVQIDRSIGYRRSELDNFLDDHTIGPDTPDEGPEPDRSPRHGRKPHNEVN